MPELRHRPIAIVGVGAILPDAPDVTAFWNNLRQGRYSITETPAARWDPAAYWDPDPRAPDRTYSKIGGWVREFDWDPLGWHLPIPPRVAEAMDLTQKWSVAASRQALADYGWPARPLDRERTAVVLGNAMGGDRHYLTATRLLFPEYERELAAAPSFRSLPETTRAAIAEEYRCAVGARFPPITEDTMPGELANIIAGRIANLFDFHGPNFVCDAACASAMAALGAAIEGLAQGDFDAVLTGGIDANMSPSTFIKFCKIGALSATGTRPYADGADGFVMGEGAAVFLLKRLEDAERDGDRVYAVLRGVGGASDGRGKGITAPNPVGQRLAVERAWAAAGESPATVGLIEGHGTSTRVGDAAEVESLSAVFGRLGLRPGSVPLGSVKSNIGHLKGAAGAAGLLKAALALHHREIPPSIHCERVNPALDLAATPFFVPGEPLHWERSAGTPRRAGVSAFGFGGTNFHVVLEQWEPGRLTGERRATVAVDTAPAAKSPLRGALLLGAASEADLAAQLRATIAAAEAGRAPEPAPPESAALAAPLRLALDYGEPRELATRAGKALKALEGGQTGMWRALKSQGIHRGAGAAPRIAFLYTGQGSQYVNMLAALRAREPIVARTFAEADEVLRPLLGKPLSDILFVPPEDAERVAAADAELRETAVTQPAVLTVDVALTRLLAAYGIEPDYVMGHSLGEYGALVAAGSLSFEQALEAVSARGQEMTRLSVGDSGRMLAVFGPLGEIEQALAPIEGYVVVANLNSTSQAVVGGETAAVEQAAARLSARGFDCRYLPVSHAFHTRIVAPASEPLRRLLARLDLRPPRIPIVSNATGELYPMGPEVVAQMIDLLARQIAEPVQFVRGLETLHGEGVRLFLEVGPKRALQGFVEDVLGPRRDIVALHTNHPKIGDVASFNSALCALYAAGRGAARWATPATGLVAAAAPPPAATLPGPGAPVAAAAPAPLPTAARAQDPATLQELGRTFAEFLERGFEIYRRGGGAPPPPAPLGSPLDPGVVVTGAALGLPGTERVFDDGNLARLLAGEQLLGPIPESIRGEMARKRIVRLVKSDLGGPRFEPIESTDDVVKLAARAGALDLVGDFGFPPDRVAAWDRTTQLAIGAGIDALRDAGIPLVLRYKTTTTGSRLPDRWGLPDELRDSTGVVFASAFPGYDQLLGQVEAFHRDRARRERLDELARLRPSVRGALADELDRAIAALGAELDAEPFAFDRRFLFQVLAMGHSQFAEAIGARGPNAQINSACASTTQAVALAADWIRAGRCRRVVVIAADDITSDRLLPWFASGFLASGAAATDERVEDAALPFDRRRHGLLIGMGAAAIVVESSTAARERGLAPICELLGEVVANSAFHGSRLDVTHIRAVMERLVAEVESRWGVDRHALAPELVFVSHETYTPARGGSAQAEVDALRAVFGASADRIVIANTKGFTGHPMGVGIEDVLAVKSLETGCVPPVPNLREIDPELGELHLSRGGRHPVRYALRLGAGFGSQVSMTLMRWLPPPDGRRREAHELGFAYRIADPAAFRAWLGRASGEPEPDLEVVHRTLRLVDRGAGARAQAPAAHEVALPPPPAASAPAPPVPAPPPPAPPPPSDPIRERVLALVASQTGYPAEMLALDLDLEADLGIDTVKQAELFAAVRAEWGIERDPQLKLRDFPTLAHTIEFVYSRRPDLRRPAAAAAVPPPPAALPTPPAAGDDGVAATRLGIVAEATGYPREMLDFDLDLEADLGIDTVKQAEMFAAIRERYGIARDPDLKLREFNTLAKTLEFVYARRPDLRLGGALSAAATPRAAAAPAPSLAPPAADEVVATLLEVVAGATGYPAEMLALDLDLEADLGIDTVKQAEIFAAVRERYGIARDPDLRLKEFNTLAKTAEWVRGKRPDLAAPPPPPAAPTAVAELPPAIAPAPRPAVDFPRRVPRLVLRPPIELAAPTGIALGRGDRVVLATDGGGVAERLSARLRELGVEVLTLRGAPVAPDLEKQLAQWLAGGPVRGLYWLPALDPAPALERLDLAGWREALRVRAKLLATALRALDAELGRTDRFVVAATRLGGGHGADDEGAAEPLGGAVCGLIKAWARERPETLVKVVDFETMAPDERVAERLLLETRLDPGAVEIGWRRGERATLALVEEPPVPARPETALDGESVFVVSGAAGSIVSAIVADLARTGGTFHLLDLAAAPDPEDRDLARFRADREGLKRDLAERLGAGGERVTPVRVERELAAIERRAEALGAMAAISANGGRVRYHQVDLRDGRAVAAALEEVRRESGRVDVLLHAAGLEVSKRLADKPQEEFDRVFDVKADGWFNLLGALASVPIGTAMVFSSIAGRFGNAGQTDYAAANELLAKSISHFVRRRPGARGVVLDWTGWAGIGMASRGSIPQLLAAAGIDLVPPEVAIPVVRRELESAAGAREVVVAGRLGGMLAGRHPTGGLAVDALAARAAGAGPMVGRVVGFELDGGLIVDTRLDPAREPFLDHHRIDGTALLPGVMGIEAFAEIAALPFPERPLLAIEGVEFHAPLKFYRNEPRAIRLSARFEAEGEEIVARCRLEAERRLPGREEPVRTLHFSGSVRLGAPGAEPPHPVFPAEQAAVLVRAAQEGAALEAEAIYRVYFHGPAYQVLARVRRDGERLLGESPGTLPAEASAATRLLPRALELAFQTAGIPALAQDGTLALPAAVARIRLGTARAGLPWLAAVRSVPEGPNGATVLDRDGRVIAEIEGYTTAVLEERVDDERLRSLRLPAEVTP